MITREDAIKLGIVEVLKKDKLYPLADYHPLNRHRDLRAVYTGEKRPPKKGEWYLSGAIIEAYQAKNDLTTAFHIAKIVQTITKTTLEIVEISE